MAKKLQNNIFESYIQYYKGYADGIKMVLKSIRKILKERKNKPD